MSAPAIPRSKLVSTTPRIPASASSSAKTPSSSAMVLSSSAFITSGRKRVTTAMSPSRSTFTLPRKSISFLSAMLFGTSKPGFSAA